MLPDSSIAKQISVPAGALQVGATVKVGAVDGSGVVGRGDGAGVVGAVVGAQVGPEDWQ